jgi:hypothetical protein
VALIRASGVLQRLLCWGLVWCFLKCESMFFSLCGMSDRNLNMCFNRFYGQNKFWHGLP